jgi:hypothetical protein
MTMFQTLRRTLSAGATLKAECGACRRRVEFRQAEAFARFGPDASPFAIRARLRCEGCGARDRVEVWI